MPEEFAWETGIGETEQLEFAPEVELGAETSMESSLTEADEMELAAELLEISSEGELDRFIADLIRRGGAIGGYLRSELGQALGGILKGAARQTLPAIGTALGTALGRSKRGATVGRLASAAGSIFGLELEGLSGEDQEFEVARRFVRFAGTAAGKAAMAPPNANPLAVAKSAAVAAARAHAPGLLRSGANGSPSSAPAEHGGRWVRRGRQIILFNCSPQ